MELQGFKSRFQRKGSLLYFNSGNLSFCSNEVLRAQEKYRTEFEENPTLGLKEAWGKLWAVQEKLANFVRARPNDLFLRTNTTSILNTFLLGLPLERGSEILLGEWEYGALVNSCRYRAEKEGLSLRVLKIPGTSLALSRLTEDTLFELVSSQISKQTRLLFLSHVLMGTGLVLPIERIAKLTREKEIFFVVDGAYALGAKDLDFSRLEDVDCYGGSFYKWMMGPKGSAFGWVAPRNQEFLEPRDTGWTTFESEGPFKAFGGGSRFQERFSLMGCHDFSPFFAIKDTIEFWEKWGAGAIRESLFSVGSVLDQRISEELHWKRITSGDKRLVGPLYAYPIKGGPEVVEKIRRDLDIQLGFMSFGTQGALVFSPHAYNSREEIAKAVTRLSGIARFLR